MSETQALDYPLDRAFALLAWHAETNPYGRMVRVTDGYIAQEAHKLNAPA